MQLCVHSNYIIVRNIYFTVQNNESSLDSLIPIIEAYDCFAMKQISSILGSRLSTFKCKVCQLIFENIPFGVVMFFVVVRTIACGRCSWFIVAHSSSLTQYTF